MNFSRSALFHGETRVCQKYFVKNTPPPPSKKKKNTENDH